MRTKHIAYIHDASVRQCDQKSYKRIGHLALQHSDVTCIPCLKIELSFGNLPLDTRIQIEDLIKQLTYQSDFDKLLK